MADAADGYELVASFFTLTGAGFGEEPRNSFVQRGCSTLNWPHCSSRFWPHLRLGVVRA